MSIGLVIVGASYAGIQIAATAREYGYAEPILMLGDEPHAPYHKPPLSKGYLTDKVTEAALPLRGDAFFTENAIEFVPGSRVQRLDLSGRRVILADGRHHAFAKLALTCGARARRLAIPGADLDGVHVLRTLEDARALRATMQAARRAVVIGGGYVGLEVAASLIGAGLEVTVLEQANQVLARVAAPPLAGYLARKHAENGVDLRFGMTASAILGAEGTVRAVECQDGTRLPCDLVVIGIGAIANGELAAEAGLACRNGSILVDDQARTSVSDIVAAGDCAVTERDGQLIRLESVQNANDQARAAATALLGLPAPVPTVPWFWSDQYELKLQTAGLAAGYDAVAVRGSMAADRFGLFYFRNRQLIAVDTVNRPGDHLLARRLLSRQVAMTADQVADETIELRTLFDQGANA